MWRERRKEWAGEGIRRQAFSTKDEEEAGGGIQYSTTFTLLTSYNIILY